MRRSVIIIIFLLVAATMNGQLYVKVRTFDWEAANLERLLNTNMDGTKRLSILLQLAEYNLYKMDNAVTENSDLEKAGRYINETKLLYSRKLSTNQAARLSLYESTLNRKRGDTVTGKQLANQAISQMDTYDNGYYLALAYVELSRCYQPHVPEQSATVTKLYDTLFDVLTKQLDLRQLDTLSFDLLTIYISKMRRDSHAAKLAYVNHLINCFKFVKDKANEFWTRKELADLHYQQGKFNDAINELLVLVKDQKEAGNLRICWTYDLLSGLYAANSNFDKAIFYSLEALKSVKTHEDSSGLIPFYARVAYNYSVTGSTAEAVQWNMKRLNELIAMKQTYGTYGLIYRITSDMIKLNRPSDALNMLLDKRKTIVPIGNGEKKYMLLALAQCYAAVDSNVMAEKYGKELMEIYQLQVKLKEFTSDPDIDRFFASFYFKMGQYDKAENFLNRLWDSRTKKSNDMYVNYFLFRLDSAKGNYFSAIEHLQTYHRVKDSIFNNAKSKQIEELKITYATEQKDSLISLKEQNIQLLTKQDHLQKSKLQQGAILRNISLAIVALLIIIMVLLYNRYRLKQRTNRKLELQQNEIAKQNDSLHHLLTEKEWLLKEIHHRVKNNLQIVMSLLNSQSVYIDNDAALTAINDSQHRVHAMSLIHQKLYNSENVSSIDMSFYIRELVSYLSDSFYTGKRIRFEFNIEPLEMDVSQAVPLGLILNEAITNSIKYAFPDGRNGVIAISLSNISSNRYLLNISDNGVGVPANFKKTGSLGMSLMKGLSEDLDGNFSIENNNGTQIKISFVHDMSVKRPDVLTASFISHN